jgi:hypothetical protein
MCVLCFVYGQKFYPIPYKTGKDTFYLILAFGVSYAGFYLDFGNPAIDFFAKNSLILLFGGVIWILEKDQLRGYLRHNSK